MKTLLTGNRLLDARKEGLQHAEKQVLRPLGKLWGMDVFTWQNPAAEELAGTIASFAFPVFWMGNAAQVAELAAVDADVMRSLAWCGQYGDAKLGISRDIVGPMPLFTATESLDDALTILSGVKQPQRVLLFTFGGAAGAVGLEKFEEFVRQNSK